MSKPSSSKAPPLLHFDLWIDGQSMGPISGFTAKSARVQAKRRYGGGDIDLRPKTVTKPAKNAG